MICDRLHPVKVTPAFDCQLQILELLDHKNIFTVGYSLYSRVLSVLPSTLGLRPPGTPTQAGQGRAALWHMLHPTRHVALSHAPPGGTRSYCKGYTEYSRGTASGRL